MGKELKHGEPCEHPGCLSHVSHPCEGCGRIAGRPTPTPEGKDWVDKEVDKIIAAKTGGQPEYQNPPVNEVARIINQHFLDSPYEGKDWETVRKSLIESLTHFARPVVSVEELIKVIGQFELLVDGDDEIELAKAIHHLLEGKKG